MPRDKGRLVSGERSRVPNSGTPEGTKMERDHFTVRGL